MPLGVSFTLFMSGGQEWKIAVFEIVNMLPCAGRVVDGIVSRVDFCKDRLAHGIAVTKEGT